MNPDFKNFLQKHQLRQHQAEVFLDPSRFRAVVAGRRFGKTELALIEAIRDATLSPNRLIWYIAPTEDLARTIAWDRLKALTAGLHAKSPNETRMRIDLSCGSTIQIHGGFKPQSLVGIGLNFVVLDEYASMDRQVWSTSIRPALADRVGRALFIGTPLGRNHFYDLYEHATSGLNPEWAGFQFTTLQGGNVTAEELLSAARDLDEQTYQQQMEGKFANVNLHRVYHSFDPADNIKPVSFDPLRPLVWALDFNVNPMCMLLMQKIDEITHVLEEIIIRPNANTELACQKFEERALFYYNLTHSSQRPFPIRIYGDASGGALRTSGSQTDWTIIREFFTKWVGTFLPQYFTMSSNPLVRDRINCVRGRLRNHNGETRIFIHPNCKELIRDLEEVSWSLDSTGTPTTELDKSDKNRTHTSDALGYFIYKEFPMLEKIGFKGDGHVLNF